MGYYYILWFVWLSRIKTQGGSEALERWLSSVRIFIITDSRFDGMSNNSKLLYGLMLDRLSLSKKRGWLDEANRVYIKYSINNIEEDLNVSHKTASTILKELEAIGLIDIKQQNGVANVIYVKNFVSERHVEESVSDISDQAKCSPSGNITPVEKVDQYRNCPGVENTPVQNLHQCNYDQGTGIKISVVPGENLHPINNNTNTLLNDNNSISQSYQQVDAMDETTSYMELIKKNIDYDIMMQDNKWLDREMYDELYQIICDVVCVPRKTIRIGGEDYPYNLVKSKFLKLNSSHLEYVIECMRNNTTKVANIKAYVITTLYNAPNTISHYYTVEVNHDMAWG